MILEFSFLMELVVFLMAYNLVRSHRNHKNFRQNYFQKITNIKTLDMVAVNGDGKDRQSLKELVVSIIVLLSLSQPRQQ